MMKQCYLLSACYGEYDDYNELPMFVCNLEIEAHLFLEALNNKEQPYWQKVVDFFRQKGGYDKTISDRKIEEYYMPHDLSFKLCSLDILQLTDTHPAT